MLDLRRRLRRLAKRTRQYFNKLMAGQRGARRPGRGLLAGFQRLTAKAQAMVLGGTALGLALVVFLSIQLFGGREEDIALARTAAVSLDGEAAVGEAAMVEIAPGATPLPVQTPAPTPTPPPILGRGMEGPEIQELQERLMELGYLELDESTQYFGSATEDALERFQRQVSFTEALDMVLEEDGLAGEKTRSLLFSDSAPKYCVKQGMEGSDITDMQDQLVAMGYMNKSTGYYGDETIAAIKDFQSRNNLDVDGLAGEHTHELLYSPEARESASKARQARTKANIDEMIAAAKDKVGCKYVLGAEGPEKFDCSGLVYYCLKEAGSNRRRLNAAGYSRVTDWEEIKDMDDIKKGDLIFFYNNAYSKVGHVGIAISGSTMIDASSNNGKVVRRSFETSYWRSHFVNARRPW